MACMTQVVSYNDVVLRRLQVEARVLVQHQGRVHMHEPCAEVTSPHSICLTTNEFSIQHCSSRWESTNVQGFIHTRSPASPCSKMPSTWGCRQAADTWHAYAARPWLSKEAESQLHIDQTPAYSAFQSDGVSMSHHRHSCAHCSTGAQRQVSQ